MIHSRRVLNALLKTIVEQWNYEEVLSAIKKLGPLQSEEYQDLDAPSKPPRKEAYFQDRKVFITTATEQVSLLDLSDNNRETIKSLAIEFDRKLFLPSIAEVRSFINFAGGRPSNIRDRVDGFRQLLKLLILLPPEAIKDLVERHSQSGLGQLGPLSDAIRTAGNRIRNQKDSDEQ